MRFEGPLGSFFLREDSDEADHLRRRRDRLRAGEEHGRARVPRRPEAPDVPLLGRAQPARPLPRRPAAAVGARARELQVRAGALRSGARGPLDGAHGPRARGDPRRLPGPRRPPDLRLRLGGDGRGRAPGVRGARHVRRTTASPTRSGSRRSRARGAPRWCGWEARHEAGPARLRDPGRCSTAPLSRSSATSRPRPPYVHLRAGRGAGAALVQPRRAAQRAVPRTHAPRNSPSSRRTCAPRWSARASARR